jgi:hypothetical protein
VLRCFFFPTYVQLVQLVLDFYKFGISIKKSKLISGQIQ